MSSTFRGVVFHGPRHVTVQDRPVPTISPSNPNDAIVKVVTAGLCGSDLHGMYGPGGKVYRGHQPMPRTGYIIGHEFTGKIVSVGSGVKQFKVGDHVVSPFTSSCGKCFYCLRGLTSRCEKCLLFGCDKLDGGQAEMVRVPEADGTLFPMPSQLKPELAILMADIFPTGWYAATSALKDLTSEQLETDTIVVIGCGPVGLLATIVARTMGAKNIYTVDSNPSRLETAQKHGAKSLNLSSEPQKTILEATQNRGADVVIEAVGHADALRLAYIPSNLTNNSFDILRPFGFVVSIGVQQDPLPFTGPECYNKNLRVQFGRCPVRGVFNDSLKTLLQVQDELGEFVEVWKGLEDAPRAYELFDKGEVGKIAFDML